jgi:S-DNA-T family DNA segregation ATPase FtsK/SpoIIIE
MILSLLYRLRPDQCRMIMIDPKMLELSVYDGIPHLLTPVVTDPRRPSSRSNGPCARWKSATRRCRSSACATSTASTSRVEERQGQGRDLTSARCRPASTSETGKAIYEEEMDLEPLPFIVIVVDEMADLMMVAGKDIEGAIQRLAQMARAAGIHVILATQRPVGRRHHRHHQGELPDPHFLPGHIEDRQPHHSQRAGRRAAPGPGRHALHGRRRRISRVHGPFVSDEEVEKIVRHLKAQGVPEYLEEITAEYILAAPGTI